MWFQFSKLNSNILLLAFLDEIREQTTNKRPRADQTGAGEQESNGEPTTQPMQQPDDPPNEEENDSSQDDDEQLEEST